jgi:hypothetical protein
MAFCGECGSPLPEGSRFCSNCGKAVTVPPAAVASAPPPRDLGATSSQIARPSRGGPGLILPLIILAAIVVIGVVFWTQRDGARPIAGDSGNVAAQVPETDATAEASERQSERDAPADATSTTAASLDSAFNSDPQGARDRYTGPLSVSGTIATMVTPGSSPSLSLEGRTRFNFVVANLESGAREQLATLAKGDRVTLSCRSVTALAGTTLLKGCALD